jgi:hypothetical protein
MDERDYKTMNSDAQCNGDLPYPSPNGNAYLVAIKSGQKIEQIIIVAEDVFDVEIKVKQTFKRIDWWEIRFNYGTAVL